MVPKTGKETLWLSLIMAAVFTSLAVVFIRNNRDPVEQIASMSERIELVHAMRLALAAASEAQNSAVMAVREMDSKMFFEEARKANETIEILRAALSERVKKLGDPVEIDLVKKIDQSFREFQMIDNQILDLDMQNSNGKAFDLAFGPARRILKEIDDDLYRIVLEHDKSPSDQKYNLLQCISDTRIRLLRIQILLAPHIAEASEQKMDEFEQQISVEDKGIQQDFELLSSLLTTDEAKKVAIVSSRFTNFLTTRADILRLSRDNTALRSVSIALNEKRVAMLACQDALAAIEKAIRKETIASMIPSGRAP